MGFELIKNKGKNSPLVICDICGKPILKANDGVLLWSIEENKEGKIPFKIAHKGKCDNRTLDLSMDLREYFAHLDANCIRETKDKDRSDAEFMEEL